MSYSIHYKHNIDITNDPYFCSDCEEYFEIPDKVVRTAQMVEKLKSRIRQGFNPAPETSEALYTFADSKQDLKRSLKMQGFETNPDYDSEIQ